MAYDLKRFAEAQAYDYKHALAEIKSGHKRSHWMWYIFPQLKDLGFSSTAKFYGIDGMGEAKAYIANKILRENLLEISGALLELASDDPTEVMGYPDDLKLCSSMTLFSIVAPEYDVFQKVLDKYFHGEPDLKTVRILKESTKNG